MAVSLLLSVTTPEIRQAHGEVAASLPGRGLLYSFAFAERLGRFRSRGQEMNRGEPREHSSYDTTKNL